MDREYPVNPVMVVLARESRSMTQKQLADRLGVKQGTLSRIEIGVRGVSDALLERLCQVLEYPIEFFFQTEQVYGFGPGALYHRRRRSVTVRILHTVRAQINIRRIHLTRMLQGIEWTAGVMRPMDLEDYKGRPEAVAQAARAEWHLSEDGPIADLTAAFEAAGGIVIPFDFGTPQIDAISQWPPGVPPLIFADIYRTTWDRLRFDFAHEIGHLIMHRMFTDADAEMQAHKFASEFLMPARSARPYLFDLTLEKLAGLKPYWKISMGALIKRAESLGTVPSERIRSLWVQMGATGYKIREPEALDLPQEKPQAYEQIIRVYRQDLQYGPIELARMLALDEAEARNLYYGRPGHLRVVG